MGQVHKKVRSLAVISWLLWLFLSSGCNWLSQGTGKLGLVRSATNSSRPTGSTIQAGAIALGEGITSELSTNLISAGLTPSEAQIIADSSQTEIIAAAGQISIQTLALIETNPLTYVAGPAVRGAIKALDEPGVNLTDGTRRAAIAQVVMSSTVGSLGGRTEGLSTDQVMSLQKDMVGTGVKSLNDASLGGDQAANAIKALTAGAAESLSKSVDPTAAAAAAASIVSGAVESISAAGISNDLIQSVVGSAVEGVVAQLSKTGVQDTAEAASLVAKSSVQSLKVLALPVEKIIEATEGAAKGAVSALSAAGVSKEAIATAAQKVASSSAAALKSAGVPDDSVGKAAGAIASGAIQGLGSAGLTASEIAASKSVSAIVSGASSGVAASGVATEKISSALGDVAGTAITSLAKLAKTTSGDIAAIQSQVVSEVIQSTIAQAITSGVASSSNISTITSTIASGAGQGLASLSKSGVTVTNVESVIKQATVTVLTEQQTKIGIDSSTITSVATSAGQTAEATKTAEVAKTSGTTLPNCGSTFPDTMSDADFRTKVKAMTTLPTCERDPAASCPKKRYYPEANASWIAIANSNICQFALQKHEETAPINVTMPCPTQLIGPVANIGLQESYTQNQYQYRCAISQGLCPAPPFDAYQLSPQPSGPQTCLYARKLELANQILIFPPSDVYNSPQNIWISAPKGATVYVTDNGTQPTAAHGMIYDGEPRLISSDITLRAVGTLNGSSLSEAIATYVFTDMGWEPPKCEDVFPNKTSLSENDLKGTPFTNDFMDVTCTAPTVASCPTLQAEATGYTFTQNGTTDTGRYFCDYSRNLATCPGSVYPDASNMLLSIPLAQTAFQGMSLPEKPFTFERACQYSADYTNDLRFPMVDATLKGKGYFAEASTDTMGRRRIAIYMRSRPCPGSTLTLNDLDFIDLIEHSGQKACEVDYASACPAFGSDVSSKFNLSTEVYIEPDRKRCVFTPVTNTCPAANLSSDQLSKVSGWREELFLCSIDEGACPAPMAALSKISPSATGQQTCVYGWSNLFNYDEHLDVNLSVTFEPQGGFFDTNQFIVLSETSGATIHYTLDGTTPTLASANYVFPIVVTTTTNLRAIAFKDGKHSPVFSATFIIKPLCSSLSLENGSKIGPYAWSSMFPDPQQSSRRGCRVPSGSQCPTLSNDLREQDLHGPIVADAGTQTHCEYVEPASCDQIFTGNNPISSATLLASTYRNDFGDVMCTHPTESSCPALASEGLLHVTMPGRNLPNGRSYCHYTYLSTECPVGIVPEGGMALLSNAITESFLPSEANPTLMDSIDGSMEFAFACRLQSAVKYPFVDAGLTGRGYYAEHHHLPGTSRIVLRHRAPPCPYLPNGNVLNLSDLQHMPFVENRGAKACEATSIANCPSLNGGNASPLYSQISTSYTVGTPATARCEYRLINPVNCPAPESINAANLSQIDDDTNPLYICQIQDGTCPSGNTDLTLISSSTTGAQRCVYEPKPKQSCYAIKSANPTASNGLYTIDPDGPGSTPPLEVYCDMTTDGGGWTLVGRGREDWAWDNNGKNIAQVTSGVGTPNAFIPAYLPATTIDKILGIDGTTTFIYNLVDGVRIKRASSNAGTTYHEVRWKYSTLGYWNWLFDAENGFALNFITCDGTPCDGTKNTRDTWDQNHSNNGLDRIFTWPYGQHGEKTGFSYGVTINYGTNSATDFLWENANEEHAIPYSEVYIRR